MLINDVGMVGLLLTYLTTINSMCANLMWSSTTTASSFSAVERLKEYSDGTELERDFENPLPKDKN